MAHYLALSGGVGGAKLVLGLSHVLAPGELTVVVNTGDDFSCHGLPVSPDIDTTLYTLAGLSDPDKGWGRRDETWHFHRTLRQLGQDPWFQLGDRDLALHVARRELLEQGLSLTQVTGQLARHLGVRHRIVPMSDQPVSTVIHTADGEVPFQDYFVRQKAAPVVKKISFRGSDSAALSKPFADALADPGLQGVIICPSNPYLSIDPILSLPGLSDALTQLKAPVVAVSPLIGGRAIKGPTAKIMAELGVVTTNGSIARHYSPWLTGLVIDPADSESQGEVASLGIDVSVFRTMMITLDDRVELARHCMALLNRQR